MPWRPQCSGEVRNYTTRVAGGTRVAIGDCYSTPLALSFNNNNNNNND